MKKLIFFLLSTIIISCNSDNPLSITPCFPIIQYHLSTNCEDSSERAISLNLLDAGSILISNIEDILSEAEIGECVLVNLDGVFTNTNDDEPLFDVYIVNDTDKLWLVNDCRE
jgi:hypothetical protein